MDEEIRILHEAMVIKERLRVLAELQSTYWDELLERGFEQSVAEQLMLEWSRHAYGMTFRALPDPHATETLDELLLDTPGGLAASAQPGGGSDPSRVPPGEPWLQLVDDVDDEQSSDDAGSEGRDAA